MKTCTKCGASKPLDGFHKQPSTRDGLSYWCKDCKNEFARNWRVDSEEKYRAGIQRYRENNRAKQAAASRLWYANNRDRAYAAHRRWCTENAARLRDIKQRRKAKMKGAPAPKILNRKLVLAASSGLCGICGKPVDPESFHIDHIVPLARGGEHSYENVQAAHAACNLRKGARVA